jgi:hypothetical protein
VDIRIFERCEDKRGARSCTVHSEAGCRFHSMTIELEMIKCGRVALSVLCLYACAFPRVRFSNAAHPLHSGQYLVCACRLDELVEVSRSAKKRPALPEESLKAELVDGHADAVKCYSSPICAYTKFVCRSIRARVNWK